MFRNLIKYRDLLFMLTLRDIRIRYKQAAMGFAWAIFMPVVGIMAGMLIKKAISVISGKPTDFSEVVSISVKMLPWTFFISSIRFSVQSLVGNMQLVTKIYFPRVVLPLSSNLASLFDFLIACVTLAIFLCIVRIGISMNLLWIPIILISLILFTAGLSLLLSCANLFYRDVKYIVEVMLMFGIFFTPVLFDVSMFGKWQTLLMLNPMSGILEALNSAIVLRETPNIFWLAYSFLSSTLIFIFGFVVFHKNEAFFAESI